MASNSPLDIPLPPIYCMKCYVRGTEYKVDTIGNALTANRKFLWLYCKITSIYIDGA